MCQLDSSDGEGYHSSIHVNIIAVWLEGNNGKYVGGGKYLQGEGEVESRVRPQGFFPWLLSSVCQACVGDNYLNMFGMYEQYWVSKLFYVILNFVSLFIHLVGAVYLFIAFATHRFK